LELNDFFTKKIKDFLYFQEEIIKTDLSPRNHLTAAFSEEMKFFKEKVVSLRFYINKRKNRKTYIFKLYDVLSAGKITQTNFERF
jgi:hypothetical protein